MKLTYYKRKKNLEKIVKLQKIVIKNRFQKKREIIDYYNTPEKLKSIIFLQQFMIKRYFSFYRPLMTCMLIKFFDEIVKYKFDFKNLDKIINKNLYCILSYRYYVRYGNFATNPK